MKTQEQSIAEFRDRYPTEYRRPGGVKNYPLYSLSDSLGKEIRVGSLVQYLVSWSDGRPGQINQEVVNIVTRPAYKMGETELWPETRVWLAGEWPLSTKHLVVVGHIAEGLYKLKYWKRRAFGQTLHLGHSRLHPYFTNLNKNG